MVSMTESKVADVSANTKLPGRKAAAARATKSNSSERLIRFLEEANLHKRDFAEMIGVTLSYVYSLIDLEIPFSTRLTTLERIAVVMGEDPESFPEYRQPEEPRLIDPGIDFLKQRQTELGFSNVQFLKRFPRNQRVEIVDMWRGALPMPLDWAQLSAVASILELEKGEIFLYWQARMQQHLIGGGIEPIANVGLLNAMFQGVKSYLKV
jgi:transcriptional regulator with XRE-family HTH domain